MAYRILSIFHPDNDISQIFQHHAQLNSPINNLKNSNIEILPSVKLNTKLQFDNNNNFDISIGTSKNNKYQINYLLTSYPFQYQMGLNHNKIKLGMDYLSPESITSVSCNTYNQNSEDSDITQSITLSNTQAWNKWKFGCQMKQYYYFNNHMNINITNWKWQSAPIDKYRILFRGIPSYKIPLMIVHNYQYRGEIKNVEGILKKSDLPTIINNSILYQPDDWLMIHLGLSYIMPDQRPDLIIGSSVNLDTGINLSYQYENQKSSFDLIINRLTLTYQINHSRNDDIWGLKYSLSK